ncbi:hypothetical protein K439DRAFT_39587 [Ramaria rubella]|nr:hypothetical protein K439DRAFT_39587 [Ramaria rubella]
MARFAETSFMFFKEIDLIWRLPWSYINALYLLVRYYAVTYLLVNSYVSINTFLSAKVCQTYDPFQTWGAVTLVPVIDILILLRIYALYNKSKKMAVALTMLWLTEFIVKLLRSIWCPQTHFRAYQCLLVFVGLGFASTEETTYANPNPGILPGCFPAITPNYRLVIISGCNMFSSCLS